MNFKDSKFRVKWKVPVSTSAADDPVHHFGESKCSRSHRQAEAKPRTEQRPLGRSVLSTTPRPSVIDG